MKKIFMNLSAGTTLAVAVALTACNNAEQVKKQLLQWSIENKVDVLSLQTIEQSLESIFRSFTQ